jgi:tripartite-type tricarboxylate transporter receptor subunit TctC
MKKRYFLIIGLLLSISLLAAGCGGGKSSQADYPNKPVNLIVAYGAGGGTDITARLLGGSLEKALGQPVTVTNVTGGGGWTGWAQLAHAAPDGYTIGYLNVPNMFAGYLDPRVKRSENLESFIPIMNHVTDYCVWIVKEGSKFKTLQDVIDYQKANPEGLTIAAHGAGGDDHLAILQIEKLTGAKFKVIHNDSTSKSISQLLGDNVDLVGCNVSEVTNLVKSNQARVLGIMAPKESVFLPGVKTFKDQGIDVQMSVSRGIAVPANTPPEIVQALTDALNKAMQDPDHVKKAKEMALALDIIRGDDYKNFLKSEEKKNKELMGW